MRTSSEEVGEGVASALGEGPSRATLAAQRVAVLEMAERSFRAPVRPSAWTHALGFVPIAAATRACSRALERAKAAVGVPRKRTSTGDDLAFVRSEQQKLEFYESESFYRR